MSRAEQFLLGSGYSSAAVQVGLLNNMPDAALRATELQFARLLKAASGHLDVRLRLFSLASLTRSDDTRTRMAGFYDEAAFLPEAGLDALIVTGFAQDEADLRSHPCWQEFTQLVDWAETGTISTLFSGLSAPAAVLHLDGIAHRKLDEPLFGIYAGRRIEDDPLLFNCAAQMPVPHARRHDLPEDALGAAGYRVLTRLENGQVDCFVREIAGRSRFVFLQGHPEYEPGTLARLHLQEMEQGQKRGLRARQPPAYSPRKRRWWCCRTAVVGNCVPEKACRDPNVRSRRSRRWRRSGARPAADSTDQVRPSLRCRYSSHSRWSASRGQRR